MNSENFKFSGFFPARNPVPALPEPESKFLVPVPLTPYLQVSSPVQGVCYSLKRIGGKWRPGNKVTNISCSFEESAQVSEMFDDSAGYRNKCRPLMETSLSAWIPTLPKTVSSTLLVLGLYEIYAFCIFSKS